VKLATRIDELRMRLEEAQKEMAELMDSRRRHPSTSMTAQQAPKH
jgi:hypothetical protein